MTTFRLVFLQGWPPRKAVAHVLTLPVYPRPQEDRILEAIRHLHFAAGYCAPGGWVQDSILVRFLLHHGMNIPEAEWAIHEVAMQGGFEVRWLLETGKRLMPFGMFTEAHVPAGMPLAKGSLAIHVGGECKWGDLAFSPIHQRLDEIARSLKSQPTDENTANRANTEKLFPKGIPKNADVVDLALLLNAARGMGRSDNEIAREFKSGNVKKANSLLSQIRRMKREGRINF